ncbi:MAG: helix-turn-helix transcriptional regulator, partial [Ekhidna sp.]|nr:helix-turn-helix transcriptional regulator [Ekhidna sp.]
LSILEELRNHTKRSILISSVHKVLVRLEQKNLLKSFMGNPTAERGGRAKKLYELTNEGKEALEQTKTIRDNMWSEIPSVQWSKS